MPKPPCYNQGVSARLPLEALHMQVDDDRNVGGSAGRGRLSLTAGLIAVVVLILASLALMVYFLLRPQTPVETVERWRDIFIIVVALESLVIGVALIVMVVQLAGLINLIQNELRPILRATSETVNTLRGTTDFLGENVVRPVIELRGYLAGISRVLELLHIKRK